MEVVHGLEAYHPDLEVDRDLEAFLPDREVVLAYLEACHLDLVEGLSGLAVVLDQGHQVACRLEVDLDYLVEDL